ncbi:MAG: family 78 glycoside hydrolase catalytic domain [Christensenellales bacterium]
MKATNLKCEYLINPIGIDVQNPRLTWICEDGIEQTAYRIIAICEDKVVWDSGKTLSNNMYCEYPLQLGSRQRIEWSITLWDQDGVEGQASTASFEMGLLYSSDWQAQWIAGDYKVDKKLRYPVDCFRKIFDVSQVEKARLYITACGLYEAKINGNRVGEFIFAPGSTDNRKRIQYQTYDVTALLQDGCNLLTVEIADGWYRGSSGAKGRVNTYGVQTKLLFQLEVQGKDGEIYKLVSDGSTDWSNDGAILFADLKDGERVDANRVPSYSGKAQVVKYSALLTASNNVEVKERERFSPIELTNTPKGKKVLKFPQNLSGYVSFKVNARKGDKIRIVLGEMLDEEGELTLKNIQCSLKGKLTPLQEIEYICKEGVNEYTPKFFYGGFQYAEIDTEVAFEKDDFVAVAVYSAFEETSKFQCSHPLINKFYHNTIWSLKSNSTDFPSDCPTRERMGWTGDSQLFFNTASYLVDYAAFARKHVRDIYDRQWKSGRLPQIAPYAHEDWFMWTMNGSVGWACAGVYIPYNFYKKYGDKRILQDNYEGIIKYANFMIKRAGKWGGPYAKPLLLSPKNQKYLVNCGQSYGEWAEPNDVMAFKWYDFAAPHPEESTAYTYFTLQHVLEIARIIGKEDDPRLSKIKKYSQGAKSAYQELVTKKKYSLDTDRQAKLVRPLYMGLLNEEQKEFAKKRLIKAMENYGWRLGTGFLSTPFILKVLADIDIEYAYRLLENEELPGWLFMPKNGATTIWEAWEGNATKDVGIASLNHYSKGAVCEWLFAEMCGIQVSGKNKFIIAPKYGGTLTYAKASYDSVYGLVESGWEKKDGKVVYSVTIPCNCKATISLPNGMTKTLCTGKYIFEEELQ